jgi:hypothetical protein
VAENEPDVPHAAIYRATGASLREPREAVIAAA